MRAAHELGRTLGELCGWGGPMTHREAEAWRSYLDWRDTVPSRADWYAMQTAALVDNVLDAFRKTKRNATAADMRMRPAPPPETPERRAARSQAVWLGFLGVVPPPEG